MEEITPQLVSKLEVLLFSYGEPISLKKASHILNIEERQIETLVRKLEEHLHNSALSGLMLLWKEQNIQLVTKPEYEAVYENLVKEEMQQELTPAALETLSIIAYLGPISRASLDYIRGVNSTFMLRNLLMRGLIEKKTEEKKGGLPMYSVSTDCLRHLGLTSVLELPQYAAYHDILSRYETQQKNLNE